MQLVEFQRGQVVEAQARARQADETARSDLARNHSRSKVTATTPRAHPLRILQDSSFTATETNASGLHKEFS